MEFFKTNSNIQFLGKARWVAAGFSILIMLVSVISLSMKGLHLGLDFTGGTLLELRYEHAVDIDQVRKALETSGFKNAVVQHYGTSQDVIVRLPVKDAANVQAAGMQVFKQLKAADSSVTLLRSEVVGAQMGEELTTQGLWAVLVAWIGTMIYVAFRFQWRFAIGAALALAHDPLLILGIFSLFQIEFDLPTVAGILAVIGYSLNDTIVVFDRVKENFIRLRTGTPQEIMNLSLNQTLSRTIMTSVMTLLVVVALLIYGGTTLFGFSLALTIGIIIGTYSSIYVAGALALAIGLSREAVLAPPPPANEV